MSTTADLYREAGMRLRGDDKTPSASWKLADLRKHAEDRGIDLAGATRKEDILSAIAGHEDTTD